MSLSQPNPTSESPSVVVARKRIAIVINSSRISGAERRALEIFKDLRLRGADVELWIAGRLTTALRSQYPDLLAGAVVYDKYAAWNHRFERGKHNWNGIRNIVGLNAFERVVKDRHVNRLARSRGVDILHVFLDEVIGTNVDAKVLFEITSPDFSDKLRRNPRAYFRGVDYFHAVSESVYDRTRSVVEPGKLGVAPIPFFNFESHKTSSAASLDEPSYWDFKQKTICFAHRLIARKNPVLFAEAARKFLRIHPDWRVAVYGNGPLEGKVKDILANEISAGKAEVGYKKGIGKELGESALFVSLIEPDNYPSQSLIEAMFHANAVVVSDTGRSGEKFLDGNGFLTPLDVDGLCRILCDLAEDPQRIAAFGLKSRRIIAERYDKEVYMRHLIGLYERVLGIPRGSVATTAGGQR